MYYCMSGIGEKLMNCQSCGTQLPTGAAACPQCGAKTPYYYSNSGASPYGPTVVAPPGSYNTPNTPSIPPPSTSYGANGYNVPPPPPYASDLYNVSKQSAYMLPPSAQNPYNFQIPSPQPPYPTQKSGSESNKRTAIIVSVSLLVLILIGILVAIIAIPRNPSTNTVSPQNKITPAPTKAPVVANPYPPNTGTLALSDPMKDNSKGYKWDEAVMNGNSSCNFAGQAYHASTTVKGALICNPEAQGLTFNNLAYNLIAAVAYGTTISVYVNNEFIASVQDNTYTNGQIGVYGEGDNGPADIIASNARVWRL